MKTQPQDTNKNEQLTVSETNNKKVSYYGLSGRSTITMSLSNDILSAIAKTGQSRSSFVNNTLREKLASMDLLEN